MAFRSAAGYGNLPNGNFSPVLYSKKVQTAFRKASIVEDITNNDYFGEISNMGDTVRIIKEPEISVQAYSRGAQIVPQELQDQDFTLIVDQANYFAFKIDDIEEAQSHVDFEKLASDRAGYRLRDQYDQELFGYMSGYKQTALHTKASVARVAADKSGTDPIPGVGADGLLDSMKLDNTDFGSATATSIPVGFNAAAVSPIQVINRMARKLDEQNVDTEGRWLVIDPVFAEKLKDEDSKFVSNDFAARQDANGIIRSGKVDGMLGGFQIYKSNNLPAIGTGPGTVATAGSASNFGVIIAGHGSAVATASQIEKVETYRDPNSFADVVRGMHLYGRKLLRPEAIVRSVYNVYS